MRRQLRSSRRSRECSCKMVRAGGSTSTGSCSSCSLTMQADMIGKAAAHTATTCKPRGEPSPTGVT